RNARVLENGDMACELVSVGVHEPMTVRIVEQDPPRRLVEERGRGKRQGTTGLEIQPEGDHASRVTLTADVQLSMLAAAVASGPIKSALGDQLRNLATLVATEAWGAAVDSLSHSIQTFVAAHGLEAVFLLMVLESACIPVPSEVTMIYAGYLVSQGDMSFAGAVAAGSLGNLVGSWIAWAVGAYGV